MLRRLRRLEQLVVLESNLTVADSDHANLTSAIIKVAEGYVKNEDKLALATTTGSACGDGFTVAWDADTGTLALVVIRRRRLNMQQR